MKMFMDIRLTKLHVLLFMIIVATVSFFVYLECVFHMMQ